MDKAEIRRNRLKDWFSERTLPAKEKSYLSQLITGRASFGEKAARRIESQYGMPNNHLDTPYSDEIEGTRYISLRRSPPKKLEVQQQEIIDCLQWMPSSEIESLIEELKKKKEYYENIVNEILAKQQKK